MVKKCARYNIGLRRIATNDGSFLLQSFFSLAVISAGILLGLNVYQWTLVATLSIVLLSIGIYRSAARLLTIYDDSISLEQGIRIMAMSNIMTIFATAISFFAYMMIFVPKLAQLL